MSQRLLYFWPGWVAGPWGAVLLVSTMTGLLSGEPQRWAAKRAARRAAASRPGSSGGRAAGRNRTVNRATEGSVALNAGAGCR